MFSGIIETLGEVASITTERSNKTIQIISSISKELKVDQSVSHDGVCLTVVETHIHTHKVTAIGETLAKSNLGSIQVGNKVNLERCLLANGRFDGHIVQGHVDQVGKILSIKDADGSWLYEIGYDPQLGNITVEKGSICVNGVSLTSFNSKEDSFTVAIIPYTYEHTNFNSLRTGSLVNLEFDVVGKYVQRLLKRE